MASAIATDNGEPDRFDRDGVFTYTYSWADAGRPAVCPECGGGGQLMLFTGGPCAACGGTGGPRAAKGDDLGWAECDHVVVTYDQNGRVLGRVEWRG